jgi:predicted small secreted protein
MHTRHAGLTCVSFASHESEEISMKRLMAVLLLALFSMGTLTACNTVAGAGKDVQGAGEKVEDAAKDCKDGKC